MCPPLLPGVSIAAPSAGTDNAAHRAKDKAILEAAYTANPKPDKAARLDLVSRVSLNEKEVQVSRTIAMTGGASGYAYTLLLRPNAR